MACIFCTGTAISALSHQELREFFPLKPARLPVAEQYFHAIIFPFGYPSMAQLLVPNTFAKLRPALRGSGRIDVRVVVAGLQITKAEPGNWYGGGDGVVSFAQALAQQAAQR